METKLLSREECALMLGVSTQTIYRWERDGSFCPSVRATKQARAKYIKTDVENWIIHNRGRANS